jgi:phage-related protein
VDLLDLFVKIGIDDSEYQQGMDEAQQTAYDVGAGIGKALKNANIGSALSDISEKVNSVADGMVNAFVSAAKTIGKYTSGIINQATGLFGKYQQLVGGVQTLFGHDYQTVLKNADNAFKNMGLSANEYMETVTSFSASLVSSLGGNTEAAAKSANLALQDMSDNANKMGTSMDMIQNAYQGFAKQNYTMLDNLKLGYGGTKTEMERLLRDAEALSGVHYDISNFDDIINAIHTIQTEIGITGTTADEAGRTIEGSAHAMEAAWQNLLTAMADPDGGHDLGQMVQTFVDTAITSIDNMMPSIEAAILGLGDVIEKLAPVVEENLPKLISDILPAITTAISTLVNVAIQVITENMPVIIQSVTDGLKIMWDSVDGSAKAIIAIVAGAWATLKGIGIVAGIGSLVFRIGGILKSVEAAVPALSGKLVPALINVASTAATVAVGIAGVTAAIVAAIAVANELNTISAGMTAETKNEEHFKAMADDFRNTIADINEMPVSLEKYEKLGETLDEIREARTEWAKVYQETNNRIAELEKKTFKTATETAELERLKQERDSLDVEYKNLILYQTKIENSLAEYSDELIAEISREEEEEKSALDSKNAMYAGYFAEAEALAQKSKEAAKIVTTGNVGLEAVLQSHLDELEHKLATHKITERQYWEEKQKWVETFRNEESESWWKYYDQVQGYYDKLSDTEIKAQEQERKKAADAQAKAQKEWEQSVKDGFSALEQVMYDEGKDKSWLVAQERAYIEALDHSSALYKEYNLKVSKEERELAENLEKERQTNQDNAQKSFASYVDKMISAAQKKIDEYEKVIDKIKEKISSFASKLAGSFKEIFEFDKDEAGNITAAKTTNVLTDSIKQLEQYYDNIQKLKERKVGDVLLKSLADMSAEEGLAVTEYYKGLSDEQLKSLSQKWDYKQMLSDKVSNAVYGDELEAAETKLDEERNTLLSTLLTDINKGFSDLVNAYGGQIPNVNVNVNGIQYQSMGDLASAVAKELGAQTNRKAAGYAV